ncbi:MAG: hypothetical protein M0R80_00090 [Proteobacteria bacterium]|jgi:hypothetical protein|nr:hypothetical protein [Pseudomonadota bacterium]
MELQELVERINRWRARQEGTEPVEAGPQAYHEAQPPAYPEPSEEVAAAEEQISELDVDPDAVVAEEATSEVNLEQIEEVD